MHPTHRRCPVRAGLGLFQQRPQVVPKVLVEIQVGLSVHARRPVRSRTQIRFVQPLQVDVVGQGSQSHVRCLFRQLRYPLLFRGHGVRLRCSGHVSLQRFHNPASPSLPRVPVRRVPLALRYYETLRRPVLRPAALRCPSLGSTILCVCFRVSLEPDAGPRAWSFRVWQPPARLRMEMTGPPKFLEKPNVSTPCSQTPAESVTSSHNDAPTRPPLF